eukprot:scaffold1558_cov403-Prasinococcus_capsulatus_cf.AAC.11
MIPCYQRLYVSIGLFSLNPAVHLAVLFEAMEISPERRQQILSRMGFNSFNVSNVAAVSQSQMNHFMRSQPNPQVSIEGERPMHAEERRGHFTAFCEQLEEREPDLWHEEIVNPGTLEYFEPSQDDLLAVLENTSIVKSTVLAEDQGNLQSDGRVLSNSELQSQLFGRKVGGKTSVSINVTDPRVTEAIVEAVCSFQIYMYLRKHFVQVILFPARSECGGAAKSQCTEICGLCRFSDVPGQRTNYSAFCPYCL